MAFAAGVSFFGAEAVGLRTQYRKYRPVWYDTEYLRKRRRCGDGNDHMFMSGYKLLSAGTQRLQSSLGTSKVSCENRQMETIKKIISKDGKYRLDIKVSSDGLYRYVSFDDRDRNDPDFRAPPEWTIDVFSGLYESSEAALVDATASLAWLREHS